MSVPREGRSAAALTAAHPFDIEGVKRRLAASDGGYEIGVVHVKSALLASMLALSARW